MSHPFKPIIDVIREANSRDANSQGVWKSDAFSTSVFARKPVSNPEMEDEQRKKDLVENLQREVELAIEELLDLGEHARVFRLCEKYLDRSA